MKIEKQITPDDSRSTLFVDITITDMPRRWLWSNQLALLKASIRESQQADPGYHMSYSFSFRCMLDKAQLIHLAEIVKGGTIRIIRPMVVGDWLERQSAFIKTLLRDTTVLLTHYCTLAQAQAITEALPADTMLRIENLDTTPGLYLHTGSLVDILDKLPVNVRLSIASDCTELMFKHQLEALPLTRVMQLPIMLTSEQCRWVGAHAKPVSEIQLPNHVVKSTALGVLNALQATQFLGLPSDSNETWIYDIITALPPTKRRCRFRFTFPHKGFYPTSLDSASSSSAEHPLNLGLNFHDVVYIPRGLNPELVEPLLKDKTSQGIIGFNHDADPKTAIAIAFQRERIQSAMRLLFGLSQTKAWMVAFTQGMPKSHIIRLGANLPTDWLVQLAQIIPAERQIMLPLLMSVTQATALAQHLAPQAILLIQGGTSPEVLKAVAEHINPLATIRLGASVGVNETLVMLANYVKNPGVCEAIFEAMGPSVSPSINAFVALLARSTHIHHLQFPDHPLTSSSSALFAPSSALTSSSSTASVSANADGSQGVLAPVISAVDAAAAARTMLERIIEEHRHADTIDLPANIPACTREILHLAFRKFQGIVRLHEDTTLVFGRMVATALTNSVALALPASFRANKNVGIAIARALKPGNKLYVNVVTPDLLKVIPALQLQVTLLLNMQSVSQQDAVTMIKLLPSGCILSMIMPAVINNAIIRYNISVCVGALPPGCIFKADVNMDVANIHHAALTLPKGTRLLIPRTLFVLPIWLGKIALTLSEREVVLMLPSGTSQSEADMLIEHLPSNLSIALPSSNLVLSSEQWHKLIQKDARVLGPFVFPRDMSALDIQAIKQRVRQQPEPGPITPEIAAIHQAFSSSSQMPFLSTSGSSKRNTPEPSSVATQSVSGSDIAMEPPATKPRLC